MGGRMDGRPNNVVLLRCGTESFYRMWVEFLTPFHRLANRERDVAARLLSQWGRLLEGCGGDEYVARQLLWTQASRSDMRATLGMTPAHFQMVLTKLKRCGFLDAKTGALNPRYIPHTVPGDPRFELRIVFDMSGGARPAPEGGAQGA